MFTRNLIGKYSPLIAWFLHLSYRLILGWESHRLFATFSLMLATIILPFRRLLQPGNFRLSLLCLILKRLNQLFPAWR
ncbi:hypothetical protein SPLC1_S050160 [Arthrospira platensis C1]|nr:hypothetical protein SPLC1_S050160 [Arthrospira platensis C1]